jgi:hypothetical protein
LLKYLIEKVGFIVISSFDVLNFNIIKSVKENLEVGDDVENIRLGDFYKEKRMELIKQVCSSEAIDATLEEIDSLGLMIDNLVQKKHGWFNLSPETIIQYIKFFFSRKKDERSIDDGYNVIFETNIRTAVINNTKQHNVDFYLVLLEEIAFFMHKNKRERVSDH